MILHHPAVGGIFPAQPSRWWVRSLADMAMLGSLDLCNKQHVADLEAALSTIEADRPR